MTPNPRRPEMDAAALLRAARAKIEKPEAWTKEAGARTAKGNPANPGSPRAICWCALGALESAALKAPIGLEREARHFLYSVNAFNTIAGLNDDEATTHADILALYDRAISLASAGGAKS